MPRREMGALGVALIGVGYWGVNYVRVLNELRGVEVSIICDPRRARLAEIQEQYPWIDATTDLAHALEQPGVDAVVVCTPAQTHCDVALEALAAGKDVLIEKPLATSSSDAQLLIERADAATSILMVGHTFIYNPALSTVKEFIVSGETGQVYYAYARRTNLGPIRYDVNAVWDLAAHDISIFDYLLDEQPSWVSAVGAKPLRNDREDVGFVTLGYDDGRIAHIHASWTDPNKVREVVVVGSRARIVFNDLDPQESVRLFRKGVELKPETLNFDELRFMNFGELHLRIRDGEIISPSVAVSEPLKNQFRHFMECIYTRATPVTDGHFAKRTIEVLEAIDASLAASGAPVAVDKASGDRALTR